MVVEVPPTMAFDFALWAALKPAGCIAQEAARRTTTAARRGVCCMRSRRRSGEYFMVSSRYGPDKSGSRSTESHLLPTCLTRAYRFVCYRDGCAVTECFVVTGTSSWWCQRERGEADIAE